MNPLYKAFALSPPKCLNVCVKMMKTAKSSNADQKVEPYSHENNVVLHICSQSIQSLYIMSVHVKAFVVES